MQATTCWLTATQLLAGRVVLQSSKVLDCKPLLLSKQVRYARKTFGLKYRYGRAPLYTDQMYNQAVEQNQLEDLRFERIRFNQLWETNSPLQDDVLEQYLRFMMRDGRRYIMYELLHEAFYQVKLIQFKRRANELAQKRNQLEKRKEKQGGKDGSANQDSEISTGTSQANINGNDDENKAEIIVDPMLLFHIAIKNCTPVVITTKIKRGGATYQVPSPIVDSVGAWYAMNWINNIVKDRPKPKVRHYHEDLAQEIIDAAYNRGRVVKKKDDLHKLAQANKAYAHYRWG